MTRDEIHDYLIDASLQDATDRKEDSSDLNIEGLDEALENLKELRG